jgi:hypothetical protein
MKYSIGKKSLFDFLNQKKVVCVAFIPVHLGTFCVQKVSKIAFMSCPNSSKNFLDFSGIYSHFS